MLKLRILLVMACVALILVVAVQNAKVVELRFLFWETSVSLVLLVFLTSAAGCVIGFALGKVGARAARVARQ